MCVEFAFLFWHVIISSILSLLSVFSQLPSMPFLGQNSLSSNQSPTCFFVCVLLWLPVAFSDLVSHRVREETPWYSQKHHCLCLLHRNKKRNTPPLMPSSSTTSTTSCNLSTAPRTREGQASASLTARRQPSAQYQSSLYFLKLEGRRKATHGAVSSERENPFYYIKFRRWAKEGDMAPRLQHSHWQ